MSISDTNYLDVEILELMRKRKLLIRFYTLIYTACEDG